MRKVLLSVLILLLSTLLISLVSAQTILWEHTWGGSGSDNGVAVTVKGGYVYIAGLYTPGDAFVAKFDLDGNLIWDRALDIEDDWADDVAVDGQGNIYIVGYAHALGAEYGFVAKFESDGDLKWSKVWPGGEGKGVAVDSAGNIYVAGEVSGAGRDVLVMKLDSDGNILWQKSWGGSVDDRAMDIALDSSGNVYVTGYTTSFTSPSGPYMFLLKFDGSGNFKWNKLWVVGDRTRGYRLAIDSKNNIYVAGSHLNGQFDAVLVKFDSDGNLLWARGWGGGWTDEGRSVAVDSSTVYLAGYTYSFGGSSEAFVAAFTSSGSLAWDRIWGGADDEKAYDIAVTGPIYLTGPIKSSARVFRDPSATITSPSATIMTPSATIGDPGITLTDQGSAYDPSITLDQLQGQDAFILSFEPPPAPVGGEIITPYSQRSWEQIISIMAVVSLISILIITVIIRKHYMRR